jgi:tRNA 2-thiouridine synthesizing protein E
MADINSYLARPSNDSPERMDRHTDLAHWNRYVSMQLADNEGIELSSEHWDVVVFLRQYYLDHGWPARTDELTRVLDAAFEEQGGSRYLYRLFPRGPLAQGTRIAGLPVPANATDASFGSVR